MSGVAKLADNLEYYKKLLLERQLLCERIEIGNAEYEKLVEKEKKLDEVYQVIDDYLVSLSNVGVKADKEDIDYKNSQTMFFEGVINEGLESMFPLDDLRAKLSCDTSYGNIKFKLRYLDSAGHQRKPIISEGNFCQYLTSFSAVIGAVKALGCNTIYIDEAFAVASTENQVLVGEMLDWYAKQGIHFVIISQSCDLYSSVPRREIRISREFPQDDYPRVVVEGVYDC